MAEEESAIVMLLQDHSLIAAFILMEVAALNISIFLNPVHGSAFTEPEQKRNEGNVCCDKASYATMLAVS